MLATTYQAGGNDATLPVIVALHGTGGNAEEMVKLASAILPGAPVLGLTGAVMEAGQRRFFRREAEGVYDQVDLAKQAEVTHAKIQAFLTEHDLTERPLILLGYSNGANMSMKLLLTHQEAYQSAALLHPLYPMNDAEQAQNLSADRLFLSAGTEDPIVPLLASEALIRDLEHAGADVTVNWGRGHQLTTDELTQVRAWMTQA